MITVHGRTKVLLQITGFLPVMLYLFHQTTMSSRLLLKAVILAYTTCNPSAIMSFTSLPICSISGLLAKALTKITIIPGTRLTSTHTIL